MSEMTAVDVDALLDSSLDDLLDLPEFKNFPAGAYNGTMELNVKQMGDNPGVELKFTNAEVVELSDPTQEAPAQGATTSVGFLLNNEFGQGALKKVLESLREGLQLPATMSTRDIIEATKGTSVMCVFSLRTDKKDPEKQYQGLKTVTVL